MWLVALGGDGWLVRDLDEPGDEPGGFWPSVAAVGDESVLYSTTDGWVLEPL
jgi:hypothetical protein